MPQFFRLKTFKYIFLIFLFSLLISEKSNAQNCNCAVTIPLTQLTFDGLVTKVNAGQTICLAAGTRSFLTIRNLKGDSLNPIIIKNCGGQTYINSTNGYGIQVINSKYFKITGTGSADTYGIKINLNNQGSQGLTLHSLSTNFEIDHLEIYNSGFAGIMAKTDPTCTGVGNRGNFTMYDVKFHDNYIHHTGGEGFYIGFSFPAGYSNSSKCKGTVLYPHEIVGCKVYNNKTEYTSADGIQVTGVTSGFELYNNKILHYGQSPFGNFQNSGISIGPVTKGPIYNNLIKDGSGNGITLVSGSGDNLIYNNLIINAGAIGIFVDERPPIAFGAGYRIINNTIINSINDGIRLYSDLVAMNHVKNNAIINPATGKFVIKLNNKVKVTEQNNYYTMDITQAKLSNVNSGDYTLKVGSPLIDAGQNVSSYGITKDFNGQSRPVGTSYDIGAYEYQLSTGNSAPISDAGANQSSTFPQLKPLILLGNGTDVNGSIASWNWTKQTNLSATMTGNTTKNLTLTNLQIGIYIFRLTCTDNTGLTGYDEVTVTVSATSNILPIVSMTNSATTGSLLLNAILTLNAEASDADGSIAKVAFMNGNTKLGEDFTRPFSITVNNLAAGVHQLNAIATDNLGGTKTSPFQTITILPGTSCAGSGTVLREQWNNLLGNTLNGLDLNDLIPNSSTQINEISQISNLGNNYASRIRGYVCPPLSGNYTFYIAGDDDCELWLSTDNSTNNKRKIASISGWTNVGDYTKYSSQQSSTISLLAGNSYYLEVIQKEGSGNDHVSVGWKLPEGTLERPIKSNRISAYINQVPTASVATFVSIILPNNSIALQSTSFDNDGSIKTYNWTKILGGGIINGSSSSMTLQLTNLPVGENIYRLTVKDNSGAESFVDSKIMVKAANIAPQSNAGVDQVLILPVNSVTLNGSGSDQDGTIVEYLWTQTSGVPATMNNVYSPNLRLSNLTKGNYTFRLKTTDNEGLTNTNEAMVLVQLNKVIVYRINSGGPLLRALPMDWASDNAAQSSEHLVSNTSNEFNRVKFPVVSTISTVPDDVFSDFRFDSPSFGSLGYSLPVSNGDYEVKLYFAENNSNPIPRTRVFDVLIEGNVELDDLNIFAEAGLNSVEKIIKTTVSDGQLDIDFGQVTFNPLISGIEIVAVGGTLLEGRFASSTTSVLKEISKKALNIIIYPNPYLEEFTVEVTAKPDSYLIIEMFDLLGKKILSETRTTTEAIEKIILNTSNLNLKYGVYLVKIATSDFATQTFKLVKQ